MHIKRIYIIKIVGSHSKTNLYISSALSSSLHSSTYLPCKATGFVETIVEYVDPILIVKHTNKRLIIEENQCILKVISNLKSKPFYVKEIILKIIFLITIIICVKIYENVRISR